MACIIIPKSLLILFTKIPKCWVDGMVRHAQTEYKVSRKQTVYLHAEYPEPLLVYHYSETVRS